MNPSATRGIRRNGPLAGLLLALLLPAVVLTACGSAGSDGDVQRIEVRITDDGCEPGDLRASSGAVTFAVSNPSSSVNNEFEILDGSRILGEKENLVAGLTGEVTLKLDPGRYDVVCGSPGNREPTGTLTVTGTTKPGAGDPKLKRAADGYAVWVRHEVDDLVRRTRSFVAAVRAGDAPRAKRLYETARIPYERIEPVAESFGGLDPAIDARENDVAPGDPWTGFHPLEKALWTGRLSAADHRTADRLLVDVKRLQRKVRDHGYDPVQMANGAVELLNEVSHSKITGEEERYSHTDLTDFGANVDGARKAFDLLRPALAETDPALAGEIAARFRAMEAALAGHHLKAGVYVNYGRVTPEERLKLSQAVDALAEPLARVGGRIANR